MTEIGDTESLSNAASAWLSRLPGALAGNRRPDLTGLFIPEACWRDVLALTWGLHTFYGIEQIEEGLSQALPSGGLGTLELDASVPVRRVTRAGLRVVEALFTFQVRDGFGRGVVRLIEGDDSTELFGWTIMTSLDALSATTDLAVLQPDLHSGVRDFSAPNWLDRRRAAAAYDDRSPEVLVVGAGQAGLAAAASLGQLGIDTLVVDREEKIGDNWRKRYHALVLHNESYANHLPFMPFPKTWPTYIPKDLLADWLAAYAEFLELNVWTSTEFVSAAYDIGQQVWNVELRAANGELREMQPRHLVMAQGVSTIPHRPTIEGLEEFAGQVLHSSEFTKGSDFTGTRVAIIGTGTSGHDLAQDLWSHGAEVTLVQRSPTTVVSVGPSAAGRVYSLYQEGHSTEVSDLINIATPYPALRQSYQLLTRELAEQDKALIEGLEKAGFQIDYGEDNTGFQMKYLRKGGGYYLDVGCSSLLINRDVGLVQFGDIAAFSTDGLELEDGTHLAVDTIFLATGYLGQQDMTRRLFGDDLADRVGPIWGFDDEGELRNMWRRTTQPGLWFTAGSLAQARIYSKFLALQIKACELGLISSAVPPDAVRGRIRTRDLTDAIRT